MLGGGSNRGNVFNWNSAAEPVALDQVFARRKAQANLRPVSLQQPLMPPVMPAAPVASLGKPSGALAAPKQRPISLAGPPAAAFGWSSSPVDPGPAEILQATEPRRPSLGPLQIEGGPSREMFTPPVTSPVAEDEEDDWGEMVSSPVKASFSVPDVEPASASTMSAISTRASLDRPPIVSASSQHSADVARTIIPASWEQPQPKVQQEQPPFDPWATSNEFSIFDSPAQPVAKAETAVINNSFTPITPLTTIPPLTIQVETPIEQTTTLPPSTDGPTDTDSLVQQILENLPDLSYMLR